MQLTFRGKLFWGGGNFNVEKHLKEKGSKTFFVLTRTFARCALVLGWHIIAEFGIELALDGCHRKN